VNQLNYKTLIPSVVGAGVLVYEAYTGHVLDKNLEVQITNGALAVAGFVVTVFGIIHSHVKKAPVVSAPVQVADPTTTNEVTK
jgi:uncharacterized membrane protein YjjB (DUF3815 family)